MRFARGVILIGLRLGIGILAVALYGCSVMSFQLRKGKRIPANYLNFSPCAIFSRTLSAEPAFASLVPPEQYGYTPRHG